MSIVNESVYAKSSEVALQIESLKDLIILIQNNVNHNFELLLAVLGITVAVAGAALGILARFWVNQRVDSELSKIKEELRLEMKQLIKDNPQFHWAYGVHEAPESKELNIILGPKDSDYDLFFPTKLEITTQGSKKLDYDAEIRDGHILHIKLKNLDPKERIEHINWSIIWPNKTR